MPDLNAVDVAWAMMTVRGTARAAWITTDIDNMQVDEVRAKLA